MKNINKSLVIAGIGTSLWLLADYYKSSNILIRKMLKTTTYDELYLIYVDEYQIIFDTFTKSEQDKIQYTFLKQKDKLYSAPTPKILNVLIWQSGWGSNFLQPNSRIVDGTKHLFFQVEINTAINYQDLSVSMAGFSCRGKSQGGGQYNHKIYNTYSLGGDSNQIIIPPNEYTATATIPTDSTSIIIKVV